MRNIKISGNKTIGENQPCFVIAEAGSNHNGDIKIAKKLIDAAARIGADAIKFQLFKEEGLSSDRKIQKILKAYEFPEKWLATLDAYARRQGIIFFATPFDEGSADALSAVKVPLYKIASGDLTNVPLLRRVASKGKPIILSVGVGNLKEIQEALDVIYATGNKSVAILHCIATYPTPIEETNLRIIPTLIKKFNIPVGFSDHTMDTIAPAISVALGGCVIEKHFTLSRKMKGPDHPFALEPQEFERMIQQIRDTEKSLGTEQKIVVPSEKGVLFTGRRSLYVRKPMAKGSVVTNDCLAILRPCQSILPKEIDQVIGKRIKRNMDAFQALQWKDLDAR